MKAGFATGDITPFLGTRMMGYGARDAEKGCESVHDPLFVRALWVEEGNECALICAYDLCFLGREECDRFKGALGRRMDVLARQVLLNTSHTHTGPAVGPWCYGSIRPPEQDYVNRLETATLDAALRARAASRPVRLRAGETTSILPINRRRPVATGIDLAPNPAGPVYAHVPLCLLEATSGVPVALLFSAACHPVTVPGWEISADFPGVACARINAALGTDAALFLQGPGGDAMPSHMSQNGSFWEKRTYATTEDEGDTLAREVLAALRSGLTPVEPGLRSASVETEWPLQPLPSRMELQRMTSHELPWVKAWAERLLKRLDRGETLPDHVTLTAQGITLGRGVRLVGFEGELVAAHGHRIRESFGGGVTFPLGYTNGTGLYLVSSDMLAEGGLEVESYCEYGPAAPLAAGTEQIVADALRSLHARGIV